MCVIPPMLIPNFIALRSVEYTAFAASYTILFSTITFKTPTSVYEVGNGNGNINTIHFPPLTAHTHSLILHYSSSISRYSFRLLFFFFGILFCINCCLPTQHSDTLSSDVLVFCAELTLVSQFHRKNKNCAVAETLRKRAYS